MNSDFNQQEELLKALIELKVIKRDGMDLFFRLEDAYGKLGAVRNKLLEGTKSDRRAGEEVGDCFAELSSLVYELQTIINTGDL